MTRSRPRLGWLAGILALYGLLAIVYSLSTPIMEASDEISHYPFVQYLATHGLQLPLQNPAAIAPYRQEGSQPPLYYLAAAALTAGINTDDFPVVYRENPHADAGIVRPDGNANMLVHNTQREAFPWQGTRLAVQVARLFSIILGGVTVAITFFMAAALFPGQTALILGATGLNAFLPMFLFVSASVNNDALAMTLSNGLCLALIALSARREAPRWWQYGLVGMLLGAGLLTKLNIGFMTLLVALVYIGISVRLRSWRPAVVGLVSAGALAVLISGWWYLRNWQLYGDPTGLQTFLDIVGRRVTDASLVQLWAERESFHRAFWGMFGGMNVAMPDAVYALLAILSVASAVGAAAFFIRQAARRAWPPERWFVFSVPLLWTLITFLAYLRWTSETPASQGRLMFGALSAICIWMILGLTAWLPVGARRYAVGVLVAALFGLAAAAPILWIQPAYAKPELMTSAADGVRFADADGRAITIVGEPGVSTSSAQPGEYVDIDLAWRADSTLDRNWSLFVHLLTDDGVLVAQRDIFPGGGSLATEDLLAGATWENPVSVKLPDVMQAPARLTAIVGWYDHRTGERMRLTDGADSTVIGTVDVEPRESPYGAPNPVDIRFGDSISLIGFDVTDLTPQPGGAFDVTLYWRPDGAVAEDYTVFVHLIDPRTSTIYASSDAQPAGYTRPTSGWQPGEIIRDSHTLNVSPDAPSIPLELEIGLYRADQPGYPRLVVVRPDGTLAENYAYLTRMRPMPEEAAP